MLSKVLGKRGQQGHPPMCAEEDDSMVFQERPKVCLVDIDSDTREALTSAGFNCTIGSLGSLTRLPNEEVGDNDLCSLSDAMPPNLHEYDIVVVDLMDREPTEYDMSQHEPRGGRGATQLFFVCEFPQTIFDPRPLAGWILRSTLKEIQGRESIIIVFAASRDDVSYHPVDLTARGYVSQNPFTYDNYSFLPSPPATDNKTGMETTVVDKSTELGDYLLKHNQGFRYSIVFRHRTKRKGTQSVKDPHFIPLVVNSADEIVSYAEINNSSILFVFPQLDDKTSFMLELFERHLPSIMPDLFPFSTQFVWLNDEEYQLPNEAKLFSEKRSLEQEYVEKIAAKEREIEENHQEFQFLHNLLTETGEKLVETVEEYFHWLGFENIVNCDEAYPRRKEEDLQVSLAEGLLVVEVKGIGGTSKDSECSQISKIKYRRAKERVTFDVFALYIVNHQRYLPPQNRSNPPFTDQQIIDAISDERGLLTTCDLFKLYFAVDSGFIKIEAARKSLLDFGLVTFRPSNRVSIGKPLEIHYNGTVGVFLLQDVKVCSDEELLVCEDGQYRTVKTVSLRDQDRDVTEASDGEIGIRLSDKITKESELWTPEVAWE